MQPIVLGIETSCDETAIGIVRGRTSLANVIASSVDEHARFGGVVPEIASRAHLEAMLPSIERALKDSKIALSDIDAIAVTAGPGLVGALLVGVASASGLAQGLGRPLYGVNHLAAHVSVDYLTHDEPTDPTIALLVSGGHSSLLQVDDITRSITKLGATMDDAAGEAFDKIARILDLGFPGGPAIDREAVNGSASAIDFPRGLTTSNDWATRPYDFSFSGLKTAVARYLESTPSFLSFLSPSFFLSSFFLSSFLSFLSSFFLSSFLSFLSFLSSFFGGLSFSIFLAKAKLYLVSSSLGLFLKAFL